MNDARFGDAILDFNMYFLGFKADDIKTDGLYNNYAFDFANAIAASQALLNDGDYFKLFDLEGDFFMAPLRRFPPDDGLLPEDAELSAGQLRHKAVGELQAVFDDLSATAAQAAGTGQDLCKKLTDVIGRRNALSERLHRAFDDAEIFILNRAQVVDWPFDTIQRAARDECRAKQPNVKRLATAIQTASEKFSKAFTEFCSSSHSISRPSQPPRNGWRSATSSPWPCRTRRPISTARDRPTSSSASSATISRRSASRIRRSTLPARTAPTRHALPATTSSIRWQASSAGWARSSTITRATGPSCSMTWPTTA
jgi:hypothetical protein